MARPRARSLRILAFFALAPVVLAAGASSAACRGILGIEDLPLRVDSGATTPDADVDGGPDAPTCPAEPKGCDPACKRDFCDDFDQDGQAPGTRWTAPAGFTNPVTRGDASVSLGAPFSSPPASLGVDLGDPNKGSYGMLMHQLDFRKEHPEPAKLRGLFLTASVRVDDLLFTNAAGSPLPDGGAAAVLGLLRPDGIPLKGLAILFTDDTAYLNVSEDVLGGTTQSRLVDLKAPVELKSVRHNWVKVEIFVGTRDRAVARGYEQCTTAPETMVAAAALATRKLGSGCVGLPPSLADAWLEKPVFLTGTLMFGAGHGAIRVDDATAEFDAE